MAPALAVPDTFRFELHDQLGSTNDEALSLARSGDGGKLWILAREQTAGRGRQGRTWESPRGNLYASLLLIDPAPAAVAPQLGFVAGVALAAAVSELLRQDRRLALKWPNDLLFARAKLAGILLDGARLADGRFACALGFGVNCVSHPSGLPYPATNLSAVSRPVDSLEVFERLAEKFAEWFAIWDGGRGFGRVRESWLFFAAGVDETIEVKTAQRRLNGVFRGLDETGRLMLDCEGGTVTIEAGDVFLAERSEPEAPRDAAR